VVSWAREGEESHGDKDVNDERTEKDTLELLSHHNDPLQG